MLRQAGRGDTTKRPPSHEVETKGKEKAKGIVNGYKRPVFTRSYEEGTDSHRKLHTRDDVFRGDEEDASTKNLTRTLHGEEDNSTKTHTGVLARDRDKGGGNTKNLTGMLKTINETLHDEEDNSTKTHTGVLTRDRD